MEATFNSQLQEQANKLIIEQHLLNNRIRPELSDNEYIDYFRSCLRYSPKDENGEIKYAWVMPDGNFLGTTMQNSYSAHVELAIQMIASFYHDKQNALQMPLSFIENLGGVKFSTKSISTFDMFNVNGSRNKLTEIQHQFILDLLKYNNIHIIELGDSLDDKHIYTYTQICNMDSLMLYTHLTNF